MDHWSLGALARGPWCKNPLRMRLKSGFLGVRTREEWSLNMKTHVWEPIKNGAWAWRLGCENPLRMELEHGDLALGWSANGFANCLKGWSPQIGLPNRLKSWTPQISLPIVGWSSDWLANHFNRMIRKWVCQPSAVYQKSFFFLLYEEVTEGFRLLAPKNTIAPENKPWARYYWSWG